MPRLRLQHPTQWIASIPSGVELRLSPSPRTPSPASPRLGSRRLRRMPSMNQVSLPTQSPTEHVHSLTLGRSRSPDVLMLPWAVKPADLVGVSRGAHPSFPHIPGLHQTETGGAQYFWMPNNLQVPAHTSRTQPGGTLAHAHVRTVLASASRSSERTDTGPCA